MTPHPLPRLGTGLLAEERNVGVVQHYTTLHYTSECVCVIMKAVDTFIITLDNKNSPHWLLTPLIIKPRRNNKIHNKDNFVWSTTLPGQPLPRARKCFHLVSTRDRTYFSQEEEKRQNHYPLKSESIWIVLAATKQFVCMECRK